MCADRQSDSDSDMSDEESFHLNLESSTDDVSKKQKPSSDKDLLEGLDSNSGSDDNDDDDVDDVDDDDDDDDAPEDVSFVTSKKSILVRLEEARKQIEKEKLLLKAKKQKQQQLYQKQKKEKLLKSDQHADDEMGTVTESDNSDDEDDVIDNKEKNKNSRVKFSENSNEEEVDFIPFLSNGGIKPVCLTDMDKMTTKKMSAQEFKQRRMFGGGIKRQTMKDLRRIQDKKSARRHKIKGQTIITSSLH